MKRKICLISILFIIGNSIIFLLLTSSGTLNKPANHFNRHIISKTISLQKVVDIKYNSYYVAGADSHYYYIGSETAPLMILIFNASLTELRCQNITGIYRSKIRSGVISICFPFFYVSDQITGAIYKGFISSWQASILVQDKIFKDMIIPLSNSSFAVRTIQKHKMEYTLGKLFVATDTLITYSNLLQRQVDGVFSNDGRLMYDSKGNLLVYVYSYRNQFICMDTDFNLLYRGHTIDTNTMAKIKLAYVTSEKVITLSQPPFLVNRGSSLFNRVLFVNSELKADNESEVQFDDHIVIDVYNVEQRTYKFSFYIPKYKNNKLKDFYVSNGRLIAIADHYLLEYKLDSFMIE